MIKVNRSDGELLEKEWNNITLEKNWRKYDSLRFFRGTTYTHDEACKYVINNYKDKRDCTCTPIKSERVAGHLKVYNREDFGEDVYYWVPISFSIEDFKRSEEWQFSAAWPGFVIESIKEAMDFMYAMLKYFELTGIKENDMNKIIEFLEKAA